MDAQTRLLRVLQERRLERLGGAKEIPVDLRVIAATKADLSALARTGQFREDLVYRLAVLPIESPPLRQRGEDVLLLFRHFVAEAAGRLRRPLPPEGDLATFLRMTGRAISANSGMPPSARRWASRRSVPARWRRPAPARTARASMRAWPATRSAS